MTLGKNNRVLLHVKKNLPTIKKRIEDLITQVSSKEKEVEQYISSSNTIKKLSSFKTKIQTKKQTSNEHLSLFQKNKICPTCTQDIEESFRVNKIDHLQQVISKYQTNLTH